MRRLITANIQNMAENEALSLISADTLERIKRTDRRPTIKVFAVAHEGTAHGTELSFGAKLQKAFGYVKDMIIRIGERLQIGTAVFNRHVDTNEHAGRLQIGEVVGKAVKYIGGKLSSLAAIYIYPEHRNLPLDVASIEAEVEYMPKTKDKAEVIDVSNITGIALGHSAIDKPAFKDATLLAVVQAFIQPETKEESALSRAKALRQRINTIPSRRRS